MVAKSLGRDYIGCELHEDYGNLIKKRVEEYKPVKEVAQEPCICLLYTSPSPRDLSTSRMPSSA